MAVVYTSPPQEWHNSLFGCLSDPASCLLTLFCPSCSYGCNSSAIRGGGCCTPCCCATLLSMCLLCACEMRGTRQALRAKHNLVQDTCGDCCVYCLCTTCAICQDAREYKYRATHPIFVGVATAQAPVQYQMQR